MAVLSEGERFACWRQLMQESGPLGVLTKAQLRAAVDAIDDWVDANAAAFNTAIPQPARGVLTSKQKALALMFVVAKRREVT